MVSFSDKESLENAFKIKKDFPSLELRKENLFIEFSLKDDYVKEFQQLINGAIIRNN